VTHFVRVDDRSCVLLTGRPVDPISVQINGSTFERLTIAQATDLGRALLDVASLALERLAYTVTGGQDVRSNDRRDNRA
jgi:hypothetical protein